MTLYRVPAIGAAVAGLLWVPFALLFVSSTDNSEPAIALAVAGMVVSPVVGAVLAHRAVVARGLGASTAFAFSLLGTTGGAFVASLATMLQSGENPVEALGFAVVGMMFLGIPFAVFGFHLALLWVAIVRRTASSPRFE